MNQLGIVDKPLVPGTRVVLSASTHRLAKNLRAEVREPGSGAHLPADTVAAPKSGPPDNAVVNFELTPLQRMIQETLDPLSLPHRSVKDWRRLYRTFFAFFPPDGSADETERKAFEVASSVFNTDLVAVCNRTTKVVPMTFQDFIDGVDSFRHDGLREGAQRDIAWQPKKTLLLMASMIGRIVAGWQADVLGPSPRSDLFPFQNHLIEANRKAGFLESVFDYDPRFSILEYRTAGLRPLLQAFPHFAHALMENGIVQCELQPAGAPHHPPLLRVHFLKPLRVPMPKGTLSALYLVLVRGPVTLAAESRDSEAGSAYFESSRTALDALAFEAPDDPEVKCSKTERLFELAVTGSLLVCGPHRAEASSAARVSQMLGRTSAEQFAIERFFALGFRNGHGNEPWLERAASAPPAFDPEKIKKARKHFSRWKSTALFFLKAGQPQAMDLPGASIRQEALQPKGSTMFLALLDTAVYAPLMRVFVAVDSRGRWFIDEPELRAFARKLKGGVGETLAGARQAIARVAASFADRQEKAVFLLECAVGILNASVGSKGPKRMAALDKAIDALRQDYEGLFGMSLSTAPSGVRKSISQNATGLTETRRKFEEAEQTILGLMAEPFSRKVLEQLRAAVGSLPTFGPILAGQPCPPIRLDNRMVFEESIAGLCAWLKSSTNRDPGTFASSPGQFLAACIEVRRLAEEGQTEEALAQLSALYPASSETRKKALAPVFGELAWSLLQAIEQQLEGGSDEKANALAKRTMAIIEGTPFRDEFKSLSQTLFASRSAAELTTMPKPSTAAPAPGPQWARFHQAEALLHDYADELSLAENQLEREFLQAVRDGSEGGFRRREKLKSRLQRRTRWGGREPFRTILKLLEAGRGGET